MIKLVLKEDYHHYILNSTPELNEVSTHIDNFSHFLLCIASSLRSNQFVVISEEKDLKVNLKLIRANPVLIEDTYISLNISLKNKVKDLPKYSGLVNLVNLTSYFKSHF